MQNTAQAPLRCGIVLAGGEGTRLKRFVYELRGNRVPKQYVNFIGSRSMLEHTFDRAERLIPRDRLFTVVSLDHLQYHEARQQLVGRPAHSVVLQPLNKETAPGVLLPLVHIYKRYPKSIVALFPSDHFILDEERFMGYVDLAFRVVQQEPSRIVLLGITPDEPEEDYGYILPNGRLDRLNATDLHGVDSFIEKPERHKATEFATCGALWNSMVMVFETDSFLRLISFVAPALHRSFQQIYSALGSADESAVVDECYEQMMPSNFSRDVLEAVAIGHPSHLAVMPVDGVLWSDWGSAPRIMKVLQQTGYLKRLHRMKDRAECPRAPVFDVWPLSHGFLA